MAAVTNVPLVQQWSDHLRRRFGPVDVVNFAFRGPEQEAVQRDPDFLRELGVRYVVLTHDGPVPAGLRSSLRRVHRSRSGDVYELRGFRRYFDTAGDCVARPRSRTEVELDCDRPATLVRLEQAFPGWSATVDDREVAVRDAAPLFQRVEVPAGRSVVRFEYAAPWLGWAWVLAAVGAGWLAVPTFVGMADRRRRRDPARRGAGPADAEDTLPAQ